MTYKISLPVMGTIVFLLTGIIASTVLILFAHLRISDVNIQWMQIMAANSGSTQTPYGTHHTRAYRIFKGEEFKLPSYLQKVPDGISQKQHSGRNIYILAKSDGEERYFVSSENADIFTFNNNFNNSLLLAMGLFGITSALIGYIIASIFSSHLTALSRQLRFNAEARLATHQHCIIKETSMLAESVENYRNHLYSIVQQQNDFTSNVNHELKTVVAAMRNTVELLFSQPGDMSQSKKRLHRLKQCVEQMGRLIKLFMKLTKPHFSNDAELTGHCVVEPAIREILEQRSNEIQQKGLTATLAVQEVIKANAPRIVLDVVLNNVLSNAIKYTNRGHISITLEQQGIIIQDTGSGIDTQDKTLVFKRWYRGQEPGIEGEGLGLSIVKQLCEQYQWTIEIDSSKNSGTRVQLVFGN